MNGQISRAYRFFSNPKITHQALQQPHYDQVLEKARFSEKLVLLIKMAQSFCFNSHPWTHGLGPTADSYGKWIHVFTHAWLLNITRKSEETEIWDWPIKRPGCVLKKNWQIDRRNHEKYG